MKVYCRYCRFNYEYLSNGDYGTDESKCKAPQNNFDTYYRKNSKKKSQHKINKNNDCKWYIEDNGEMEKKNRKRTTRVIETDDAILRSYFC